MSKKEEFDSARCRTGLTKH